MSYSPVLMLRRSYQSLSSPPSPTYVGSPSSATTASSQLTNDAYPLEQLTNANGHDSELYSGSSLPLGTWSPEDRKHASLGQTPPFVSASQSSPQFQSIRQPPPPPLQLHSHHTHLGHSQSLSDLSGLDNMKTLTLCSANTNSTPRHPASNYHSGALLSNLHLQIPPEHYLEDVHSEEWPQSTTSGTFPQHEDTKFSHIHQPSKTDLPSVDSYGQQNLFDVSSQAPHNPQVPYPRSPPYSQHVVHAYLDGKQHTSGHPQLYHQPHQQFIHPDELSPSVSASSEYDSLSCDPRYVSGVHHPANESSESWNDNSDGGEQRFSSSGVTDRLIDGRGEFIGVGYEEADAEGEDEYDDYEEDEESDSDYVARRRALSSVSAEHRTLRRRVRSQRFTPYGSYAAERSDTDGFPPLTRTRRAGSSATTASTSSSLSENSAAVYTMSPPRRRARAATALPIPVPVPNLTKKSRGRRVPTVGNVIAKGDLDGEDTSGKKRSSRQYACKVPGCGKCFARGEHLKRHVRSIHTHEKPHKCPYPGCGKDFSRHDNLGQHMRVHKDMQLPQGKTLNGFKLQH